MGATMRTFCCFCLIFVLAPTAYAQKQGDKIVVISADRAELRANETVTGTVARGNRLRVDDVNGDWFWVKYSNGNGKHVAGWIHRDYIMPHKPISKVIDFFTASIQKKPTAYDYQVRGMLWSDKGEYDIAIADYNESIRLDPKQDDAWNNRGLAWYRKREYDKAIKDYDEALRIDPKCELAWNNRGLIWKDKGEYDKAIKDYDEALRLDPKFVIAWNNRGDIEREKGNYDKAIKYYGEVIRLDPKNIDGWNNRGYIWKLKKKYENAIQDFTEVLRLDPENVYAWNSRGFCSRRTGKYYNALNDYNKALKIDSKNDETLNDRAWIYATCPNEIFRDGKQAIKDAKQACELSNWKDHRFVDTYGAALAEAGRFDEAIKQIEKAMSLDADYAKETAPKMLKLFKAKQPYREELKN